MELALLRARLDAFTQRFYDKAGTMYLQFDEARTEGARLRARFEPDAQREYRAAQEQWRLSVADCRRATTKSTANPKEVRRLHLELARKFHPDLALDPVRRSLCEQLMAEVNIAVQDEDQERLEAIRDTTQGSADAAPEMAKLTRSTAFQLNDRNQYALRQQQDLLKDLTDWLYAQANQARRNTLHNRSSQLYSDLMERALDDLQHVSVRLLRFPKDYSLGELSVRDECNIDSPSRVLGPAQGMVRVPFLSAALLRVNKDCKSLEALRVLDGDDINGLIDEWPDFVELTDEMLQPLTVFSRLEELHLGRTKITGRVFDAFPPLRELRVLILDETAFDDHGMEKLGESIWMQRLDLSSTKVTGQGLRELHRMKSLRDLSLYSTQVGDEDLAFLDALPQLRNLNFGLTRVTDASAQRIAQLQQLEVLHLGGTEITDAAIGVIATLPVLRDVVLWETKITDAAIEKLAKCPSLRYLDADQTLVTSAALGALREARPEVKLPSDLWCESS